MIASTRSAAVRQVVALQHRKARSETGLFLLEGPQCLAEAVRFRPEELLAVYLTADAMQRHARLAEDAAAAGIEPRLVTDEVLAAMADTVTPQGVVAIARQSPVGLRAAFADARLAVILDGVSDPGNAGTVIRSADAAGASVVVFTEGSVDPYNPKVVRSTTGSIFHVRIAAGMPVADAIGAAKDAGLAVFAADMGGTPLPQLGPALANPTTWLFGNEAHGVSTAARSAADSTVAVPIYGDAESLNLATAASVCLYSSAFAQRS